MKKVLRIALLVGGIAAVAKIIGARKSQWEGLTESQVREKLDTRLPGRMPMEKKAEVADKVVSKMQERGLLASEEETEAADDEQATPPDIADASHAEAPDSRHDESAGESDDQSPESGDTEVNVDVRDDASVESA